MFFFIGIGCILICQVLCCVAPSLQRSRRTAGYGAARLILKKKKKRKSQPVRELCWLPIAQLIDYKYALPSLKCIRTIAPHYLRQTSNLFQRRRSLRSTEDYFVLKTPMAIFFFGDHAFSSYGPRSGIHFQKESGMLIRYSFKKKLKHDLFLKHYVRNNLLNKII